jgi:hypothetical protein
MTIAMIQAGDSLFHGRAGCFGCHGIEGQGLPVAGDAVSVELDYVAYNWRSGLAFDGHGNLWVTGRSLGRASRILVIAASPQLESGRAESGKETVVPCSYPDSASGKRTPR